MKINNIINEEIRSHLIGINNLNKKRNRIINENEFNGKTIINVDIQEEYENWITFNINDWVDFINDNYKNNNIIFLYNGESMGMTDKNSYIYWLFELGINEEVLESSDFYDKGYAYFRYCMDNSIDEDNIVDLVKFMLKHNINDSRDINTEMWELYMQETNHNQSDVRDLLENASDLINIPDVMDYLSNKSNIILLGGGINECLKEVEIALLSLDKNYNIMNKFTY